jgi:hypothetical protein
MSSFKCFFCYQGDDSDLSENVTSPVDRTTMDITTDILKDIFNQKKQAYIKQLSVIEVLNHFHEHDSW